MRACFLLVTFACFSTGLSLGGCSSDESTTASDAAGAGASSTSGAGATGADSASAASGAGASGGAPASSASSASSSSAQGGAGGGAAGCDGKACGSACLTEAGDGMCDPSGSCVILPVSCPGYTPCTGVKCGTACSSCDPTDPTCVPARGAVCDITLACIYPPPACD